MQRPATALALALLLAATAAARAAPSNTTTSTAAASPDASTTEWRVGDVFVGSHGRVVVVDGSTLAEKAPLHLFHSGGRQACRSWVTGSAFNADGSLLYLLCQGSSLVMVVDVASPGHPIIATFPTAAHPSSIAVDRSGNLYVGSGDSRGRVQKHAPNGTVLATLVDAAAAPWLALSNDETRLLSTRQGQQLHQYNLTSKQPVLPARSSEKTTAGGSQCFGLQPLDDGSVLVACRACVHQVLANTTSTTTRFCASNATAAGKPELKLLALDPTGGAFYAADAAHALVHKVSLQGEPLARIALNGTRKIHSLTVLRRADDTALAAQRARNAQPIAGWGVPIPVRANRPPGNSTTGGRRKRGP